MIYTRTLKDLYKSLKEFIENHRIKNRQPTYHRSSTYILMVKVYIIMVINHEQVGGEKRTNRHRDTHNGVSGVCKWGRHRSLKRSTTSVPYKQKPTDYIIRRLELVRVVG